MKKKTEKKSDLLLSFLIHLNEKGLVNNHDFDWEKESKRFIKNLKKYGSKDDTDKTPIGK